MDNENSTLNTEIFLNLFEERFDEDTLYQIIDSLCDKATKGDVEAIKLVFKILDRLDEERALDDE